MSGNQQVTSNTNSFNFSLDINAEGHRIPQQLSLLEPEHHHRGVRTNRPNGVGNWLLEPNEFGR